MDVATTPIRLIIADDHPVVREGLVAILETQPDIDVLAEASDGVRAVELAVLHQPDVMLMDLQMPNLNGVDAIRQIKERVPATEIVVLTTYDSDEYIFKGIEAGARGYLLKGAGKNELLNAIRAASRGEALLPPVVAGKLVERFTQMAQRQTVEGDEALTERELEVLELMAQGARNKEIAHDLSITERTAKAHVSSILGKLAASDRTEAVTIALRKKLISL
ncbi:MAG: response regulator transcription factor [Chloroflexi bacterium]|nr:response regulator transcription factor [Chloroflexota bacterium]